MPEGPTAGPRRLRAIEPLEQRNLLSADPVENVYHDMVSSAVVNRQLFYNQSSFDGNSAASGAADDGAIATDKTALLPGQAATFANYTSYNRGINGLLIDIAGLPSNTLTADDFQFRIGNSNDPSTWSLAPAPTSINIRPGAGTGGSARVDIVWANGAISKTWLEVTVKATNDTGLTTPDVFYFGNAVGDTGDHTTDAKVDTADQTGAQNNPTNSAAITNVFDFNRNGIVDANDATIAGQNQTSAATALKLITPAVQTQAPPDQRMPIELFNFGDADSQSIAKPALITTTAGTVLAFAENRATLQDFSAQAIVLRRSTDGGATWSSPTTIYSIVRGGGVYVGNIAPVVDQTTGAITVVFNRSNSDVLMTRSTDDGLTWTTPQDITTSVKVTAAGNPGPPGMYPDTPWGWYAVGPGHGIQLENGPFAGRLIISGDHRETANTDGTSWSQVIYSDDHGVTWHLGGGLIGSNAPGGNAANDLSNESTVVELSDGSIYMSIRIGNNNVHSRGFSVSHDGGITWSTMALQTDLPSTAIQGSLLRIDDNTIAFAASSNPLSTQRTQMTVFLSHDDGQTWTDSKVIFFGYSGYVDMAMVGPDTFLVAYERGHDGGGITGTAPLMGDPGQKIGLVRVNVRFIQSTDPYQFSWYFNEEAPGTPANKNGTSIQDYGLWDQRAWAFNLTGPAPTYVAGPNGDTALALTTNLDEVLLTTSGINALQIAPGRSFTAEITFKTTGTNGVIIGTRPTIQNWTLQLVNGKVQFSLTDLTHTPTITSDDAVNDGNWHTISAVRDVTGDVIRLYVDGVEAATPVADNTVFAPRTGADPIDPVTVGAYNNSTGQLALTVDTVRFTQAALAPADMLPTNFVSPKPPAPPTYLPNNPTSIPGLQFWLPSYDYSKFHTDFTTYADPAPLVPFVGMGIRSMIENSSNRLQVSADQQFNHVLYQTDSIGGASWQFTAAPGATKGDALDVHAINSNPNSTFSFVQSTGIFTLSVFAKVGDETGGTMTIFDTSDGKTTLPGFSLFRQPNGQLGLLVTGSNSLVRFNDVTPAGTINNNQWYHIAVVGNGPGQPVKFYVTPVNTSNVAAPITSTTNLTGANGDYTQSPGYDLFIGSRSNTQNVGSIEPFKPPATFAPFNGLLTNEAIFDQALTPQQIQQLFLFGRSLTAPSFPWHNTNLPLDVDNNGLIQPHDIVLVINKLLANGSGVLTDPVGAHTFIDTTGNGSLAPQDVVLIINYLLANPPTAAIVPTGSPSALAAEDTTADSTADSTGDPAPGVESAVAFALASQADASSESDPATSEPASTVASVAPPADTAVSGARVLQIQPTYATTTSDDSSSADNDAADNDAADKALAIPALAFDEVFRKLGAT